MKLEKALDILNKYQGCRLGYVNEIITRQEVIEAIDVAIHLLTELNKSNKNELRKGN